MIDIKPLPKQKLGNLSKSHSLPVLRMTLYGMEYLFSLFGSPAWLYASQYPVPLSVIVGGQAPGRVKKRDGLDAVPTLFRKS